MSKDSSSSSCCLTVRQSAALGVAAAGLEAALLAGARSDPVHRRLVARLAPGALPTPAHLLVLLVGVLLVAVAPRLWRGTRAAVRLAVGLLCVVAVLNLVRGFEYAPVVDIGLAVVLFAGRRAFPLGSSNRTHPLLVAAGIATWAVACLAVSVVTPRLSDGWLALIEILIATAVAVSVLAVRGLLAPAPGGKGHGPREHCLAARRGFAVTLHVAGGQGAPFRLPRRAGLSGVRRDRGDLGRSNRPRRSGGAGSGQLSRRGAVAGLAGRSVGCVGALSRCVPPAGSACRADR
jgi:hypothetical protein